MQTSNQGALASSTKIFTSLEEYVGHLYLLDIV